MSSHPEHKGQTLINSQKINKMMITINGHLQGFKAKWIE